MDFPYWSNHSISYPRRSYSKHNPASRTPPCPARRATSHASHRGWWRQLTPVSARCITQVSLARWWWAHALWTTKRSPIMCVVSEHRGHSIDLSQANAVLYSLCATIGWVYVVPMPSVQLAVNLTRSLVAEYKVRLGRPFPSVQCDHSGCPRVLGIPPASASSSMRNIHFAQTHCRAPSPLPQKKESPCARCPWYLAVG